MNDTTMYDILKALELQIGKEAFEIFEWYCKTYCVSISDIAPATIINEVIGG